MSGGVSQDSVQTVVIDGEDVDGGAGTLLPNGEQIAQRMQGQTADGSSSRRRQEPETDVIRLSETGFMLIKVWSCSVSLMTG